MNLQKCYCKKAYCAILIVILLFFSIFLLACNVINKPDYLDSPLVFMNDEHAVFEGNSLGNLANHGLVAEFNGWIFFHNCANGCSLEKRQANSKKSVKLGNVSLAYSINVKEDWIYFYTTQPGSKSSNPWAGGKIHKIRIDGSDQQMLVDTRAVFLNLRGEWIYYIDLTDGYIHKIRIDGLDKQVVVKMQAWCLNVVGSELYFVHGSFNGPIYKSNLDGSNIEVVCKDSANYLVFDKNSLYYSNQDELGCIYKVFTDGTNRQKLNNTESSHLNIHGDWIYFINTSLESKELLRVYRINKDGSKEQQINHFSSEDLSITKDWIIVKNRNDGMLYKIQHKGSKCQLFNHE